MLSLILAMTIQVAPVGNDVVVTARTERRIARQVDAVLPPLMMDQPLARFTDPLCPGVNGLARDAAQAVVDRIGVVADSVGLSIGEPGCTPNLLVIVTADGRAAMRRVMSRAQGNLRSQAYSDVKRIIAEPGSARAWAEVEPRGRDGDRPSGDPGAPATLAIQGASRIGPSIRRDIVSAVIVIDSAAIVGRDTNQIADYAAMRGLADARPAAVAGSSSILAAFTPAGDATAPKSLTPLDRGILKGLYSGQGNVPSGVKRATMARLIAADPSRNPQ